MTLLRKASALHVSCNIRMGLGRDPLSLSTCRVGSRSTTTLLKKHLPSGFVLYTELRSLVVVRLQTLEQGSVKRLYFVCSMRWQAKHYYVFLSCQLNSLQVLHMSAVSIQQKKDLFVCSRLNKIDKMLQPLGESISVHPTSIVASYDTANRSYITQLCWHPLSLKDPEWSYVLSRCVVATYDCGVDTTLGA